MQHIQRRSRHGQSSEVMEKISMFTGEELPETSARLPYPKQPENPSKCQKVKEKNKKQFLF